MGKIEPDAQHTKGINYRKPGARVLHAGLPTALEKHPPDTAQFSELYYPAPRPPLLLFLASRATDIFLSRDAVYEI